MSQEYANASKANERAGEVSGPWAALKLVIG